MSKNAIISVSIFAVLLVLVVITREDKVSVGMRSLSLPTLTADAVTKIELSGSKKALLEKQAERWTVADPEKPDQKFAVEQSALDSALEALAELEAGSFVTGRPAKHEELDIDEDKGLHVRVEQSSGPALDVVFGRMAKGGGNYLRRAGTDEVFVGKGRFATLVGKDVSGWRKRQLVDQKVDELASVEVQPPGGAAYTLKNVEEGEGEEKKSTWKLAEDTPLPDGFVPDDNLIKRVASAVANLRAADFVDDGSAEGLSGTPAGGRVVATTRSGEKIDVSIGAETEGNKRYAKIDGDDQVYLVSSYATKNLTKTVGELRDLTLARFDEAGVERVVIQAPEQTVEVAKKDGAWTLVRPDPAPAGYEFDPGQVEAKLKGLARVKGVSRLDAAPPSTGLDKPEVLITVTLAGGAEKRIAFGAQVPREGDKGPEQYYARGAEEAVPYIIGKWQHDRYAKPLDLFKKVAPPPGAGMPGGGMPGGGMPGGMQNLPPEIRKQLEAQMRAQQQGR